MKNRKIYFGLVTLLIVGMIVTFKIINTNYYSEIHYNEFIKKVEKKETFVLCLTQTNCSHCNAYKPKLENVANKYKVDIYYIETDKLTDKEKENFVKYIGFNSTPTTVFIIDGKEKTAANRLEGNVSTDKLIKKLKSNGYIK